jgi:hypothetical protein
MHFGRKSEKLNDKILERKQLQSRLWLWYLDNIFDKVALFLT